VKRILVSTLAIACLLTLAGLVAAAPRTLLSFRTMYGVDGPFVGSDVIRGIVGDDLPWEVGHFVNGSLTTDGHLKIIVRGLVFPDKDPVPVNKRGINDEPNFRGLVSCLTEVGDTVQAVSVATPGFPATATGNSNIDAIIALPNPCVAPIIFVTGEDPNKWFAVTGFETEEE
jgi:hypothetical protein